MYALASNLFGFKSTSLRVRITRTEGNRVWVRTADLQDSGTPLVLDASQLTMERPVEVTFAPGGFVAFG